LAQYRSLEAFAMFASDLDAASRAQLTRGARLMELLKQPQYSPYPVEEQVVSIWAGTKGKLDKIPVADVLRFERELLDHVRRNTSILTDIASSGQLSDEVEAQLEKTVDDFVSTFLRSEGTELHTDSSIAGGGDVDVEQEQIVAKKKK
ncbi:MAG: F0F1 ATP synthase subunit alpha, partial [Actinomycetes bacterium]